VRTCFITLDPPEEFISIQRQRSTSCGYNSEDSEAATVRKPHQQPRAKVTKMQQSNPPTQAGPSSTPSPEKVRKVPTCDSAVNTDPVPVPGVNLIKLFSFTEDK
jgi:hypothetical protein